MSSWKTALLNLTAVLGLAMVISVSVGIFVLLALFAPSQFYLDYEDFELFGYGRNAMEEVQTSCARHGRIASVYVRFDEGVVHLLPDITEAFVAERIGLRSSDPAPDGQLFDDPDEDGRTYYSDSSSSFTFKDGELIHANLSLRRLEVGSAENGPFLSYPASRDEAKRVFGEPVRVRSRRGV